MTADAMQDPVGTARLFALPRIESVLKTLIEAPDYYRRDKIAAFWSLSGAGNFAWLLTRDETVSSLLESAASALLADGFDDTPEQSLRALLVKIEGWGGDA